MRLRAYAKVNLGLRVRPPDRSGMHPIRSLVRSIDWSDRLEITLADDDAFDMVGAGDDVPDDESNLVWRAIDALRRAAGASRPVSVRLEKSIPDGAGLGGGSADAAAALLGVSRIVGYRDELHPIAAGVGADVPFFLRGGAAWMEGYGELLSAAPASEDYALAVVVPPFALPTPAVYRRWDELDGPEGPPIGGRDLPVSLREVGPLRNDLTAAAVSVRPELGDWITDVSTVWGQPVLLTGSGSAMFGFFPTLEEAEEAAAEIRATRAFRGCAPVDRGVRITEGDSEDA